MRVPGRGGGESAIDGRMIEKLWPTSTVGAVSQRPTQGARTTRTSGPALAFSSASSASAPASMQERESQTQQRQGGMPGSHFLMMSKCA